MMKFNIGDQVRIDSTDNFHVENSGIPSSYIVHGTFSVEPTNGIITDIYQKFYLVKFKNVILGFKEENLTLVKEVAKTLFNFGEL